MTKVDNLRMVGLKESNGLWTEGVVCIRGCCRRTVS